MPWSPPCSATPCTKSSRCGASSTILACAWITTRARSASHRGCEEAWLFLGSDDHASAAANLFSLVTSCKLYRLYLEAYLADVIRVMPCWPRERYLELAPTHWARARARLVAEEMKLPLGPLTVPPPLPAEEQRTTS
ncbi:transposase domain-containing protein [Sorangium sp. So ce136]|uniref:transposase domain-containing protein n=1 Tax=Sorangium sp. So ce136 TaxID=3133284 RepID=UPI003EFC3221